MKAIAAIALAGILSGCSAGDSPGPIAAVVLLALAGILSGCSGVGYNDGSKGWRIGPFRENPPEKPAWEEPLP